MLVTLTDEGHLHQADASHDDQEKNQILQKVVLPVIRGTVRLRGSTFYARDFVAVSNPSAEAGHDNPYQLLRADLMRVVPADCRRFGVEVEDISLGQLNVGPDLAELARQVQGRELARIKREQNLKDIEELKTDQKNKADEALGPRAKALPEATTRLNTANTEARQKLETEESRLKQELENAAKRRDAAKNDARKILADAEADAKVIELKNKAEVAGLKTAIEGFPSPDAYAQYQMIAKLAPALADVFASDGGDFAKLFTQYLTPPNRTGPMGPADGR